MENKKPVTYFKGDKAEYTGTTQVLHGAVFYDLVMIEGHMKGEKKVTKQAPKGE